MAHERKRLASTSIRHADAPTRTSDSTNGLCRGAHLRGRWRARPRRRPEGGDRGLEAAPERQRLACAGEPACGERGGGELAVEVAEPFGHEARGRAEAEHLDVIAFGEQLVERNAIRRQDVRHERDRHGCAACQNRRLMPSRPAAATRRATPIARAAAAQPLPRRRRRGARRRRAGRAAARARARGRAAGARQRRGRTRRARRAACCAAASTPATSRRRCGCTAPTSCTRTTSIRCSAGARWRRRARPERARCCTCTTTGSSARSASPTATERPATAATGRDTRPGVRHRCRGSLAEGGRLRGRASRASSRACSRTPIALVAVSEALASGLVEHAGSRASAMTVAAERRCAALAERSRAADGRYALAAGRLVEEKGFDTAIRAAREAGVPLRIAGAGPDEERLRALAGRRRRAHSSAVSPEPTRWRASGAAPRSLLAPARSDDPCPMTVLEALADGLPVLGQRPRRAPRAGRRAGGAAGRRRSRHGRRRCARCGPTPPRGPTAGAAALARARASHSADAWYGRRARWRSTGA